jgi:hypothetical protein
MATKGYYLITWYEVDAQGVYHLYRKVSGNAMGYIFKHECGDIVLKSIEPIADKGYRNA